MSKELVELCVKYVNETEKAILVSDGISTQAWLPRSQVTVLEVLDEKEGITVISIPEWLATEKDLI